MHQQARGALVLVEGMHVTALTHYPILEMPRTLPPLQYSWTGFDSLIVLNISPNSRPFHSPISLQLCLPSIVNTGTVAARRRLQPNGRTDADCGALRLGVR